MMIIRKLLFAIALFATVSAGAQRSSEKLTNGWEFKPGGIESAADWQSVRVPHDWAIYGPFGRDYDLQCVAVEQNGEKEQTWKTGRTGGLPFIGKGAYRRDIEIADTAGTVFTLVFDGAMSNARVSINGQEAGRWPYGYNSFHFDITPYVHPGSNSVLVELENLEQQSRWYPGAGLYRNVHLVKTGRVHVPVWGSYVTTPKITHEYATVTIRTEIAGGTQQDWWPYGEKMWVKTDIFSSDGTVVACDSSIYASRGQEFAQNIIVDNPQLWDLDSPSLYTARTSLIADGKVLDTYDTRFGFRTIEYVPEKGFFLNGRHTKIHGVCNHHDLGPLGAAVNESALRHQVALLKEMGANAIRTSHNMPAPELAKVCDEMGMMLMVEAFDDWGHNPKSANGYGKYFNEWAERDVTNMVKQFRNSPSVVMWSIGNEVPSQWAQVGMDELLMLQGIVHRLDPTRPVTCGMDQIWGVIDNGFAAALDIPGFNYKPQYYTRAYSSLPQGLMLGSETASLVSSRGQYYFPAEPKSDFMRDSHQCNSYGTEYCGWSNIPDLDFAADDEYPWLIGQFVWTGFDYLGEPTPYDTDAWPNHSSMFGIIDLASLPKDVYYLYRSQWRDDSPTLHILPHWTWPGREGMATPVMAYTSYPEAELFVNGVSQGRQRKDPSQDPALVRTDSLGHEQYSAQHRAEDASRLMRRYRLTWPDVTYVPGELKVVAYDEDGNAAAEETVRTAGKPHHIVLTPNRTELTADGEDLLYITVQVADKDGVIVPTADCIVTFIVEGAGSFEATANGDPTCLLPFQNPEMKLFSGAATAIVRSATEPGQLRFTAKSKSLRPATIAIPVR